MARHPLRPEDLGLDGEAGIEIVRLVRRPGSASELVEEVGPDVALLDTRFVDGASFAAITEIVQFAPEAHVLALTPDPPPHVDVALAVRAGAVGFIDVDA